MPARLTPPNGQRLSSALAKGAGLVFLVQIGGTGLKYFGQILLARWMGTLEYGTYAYVFTWANLLSVFATLGFTTGVIKLIPAYLVKEDWAHLRGLLNKVPQLVFITGIGISLLWGLGLAAWAPNRINTSHLLLGMGLVPLLALLSVRTEMVRALRRAVSAYALARLLQPALTLALAFMVYRTTGSLVSAAALGALALATFLVTSMQSLELKRALPRSVFSTLPRYATRDWLRLSLPLLLVSGALVVINNADILMVGTILGAKEAGIYNAATKTATLVSLVLAATNAVVAPMIAELHARDDRQKMQELVATAAQWMFWPSLAATSGLVFTGKTLLGLFGPEFTEGYSALVLLALGQLVNASVGPVGYLISLTGHQNQSARVYGISALINVGLNFLLVPRLGLLGAAWATMLTMTLWNLWLYWLVKRLLGIESLVFLAWWKPQRGGS